MHDNRQTIDSWLSGHARHDPGHPALVFEGREHSYAALDDWVQRLARGLHGGLGLSRGDRVAYLGRNADHEVALLFAAARLGLILVPLNWRLTGAELNWIMRDCGARLLVHDDVHAERDAVLEGTGATALPVEELDALPGDAAPPPPAALTDPFLIVYTSGTTGRPKGAVMTQQAILWNAVISQHMHDLTAADHTLNILPLFHVGGINIQMMPSFFVGAQVTLHPVFDADATLEAIETRGITTTVCVPTVMRALLRHPGWDRARLPQMRMFNTGSTDVPVEIIEAVHDRGVPMVQVYGATETGPIATYQKATEAFRTVGSIGRPALHCQVRTVRPDGTDCAIDEPGEILVRGPNNFSHYWNDPEATAAALTDGWFRTGDVARIDGDGLFWFADRIKHVIISGGENIYPAELERILNRLPGLREAAVVGRPHPKWGEVPVVAAVPGDDPPDRATILAAFEGRIARFKQPRDVVFLQRLPRNALGKVLAGELRRLVVQLSDSED